VRDLIRCNDKFERIIHIHKQMLKKFKEILSNCSFLRISSAMIDIKMQSCE